MIEDINTPEEFQPLSDDQAEFLAGLATDLRAISYDLPEGNRQVLEVASSNLLRLTAMSMAGFHLFASWQKMSDLLHDDLGVAMTMLEKHSPDATKLLRQGAYQKYYSLAEDIIEEHEEQENE